MDEELKACPFCGGAARLDQRVTQSLWNSSDAVFSHVACDECDIHGQDFCDDPDGSEAIEWWNARAQLPSQRGEAIAKVSVWQVDPWYATDPSKAGRNIGVEFLGDHAKTLVDGQPLYTHPADQVPESMRALLQQITDNKDASHFIGDLQDQLRALLEQKP